jgi:hypothetical protein
MTPAPAQDLSILHRQYDTTGKPDCFDIVGTCLDLPLDEAGKVRDLQLGESVTLANGRTVTRRR